MTNSSQDGNPSPLISNRFFGLPITDYLLLLIPIVFLATMARRPVIGDPTEYTFVAHVLGVAHPPGYAFMAVVGKLYQTLIPFGNIAWRTHLLGVTAGTIAVYCMYGILRSTLPLTTPLDDGVERPDLHPRTALFGAVTVAAATNFWQHSIHANPHIVTAMFLALNLYTLTKWYVAFQATDKSSRASRWWLYAFCLNAGLGVTHHPLTVFALPACALFVLFVYPRILLDWKTLLRGIGFVLLGLIIWLYFPLRSPALAGSTQFVHDMNTLDGFLNLVLARGLRVNLFAFGLSDQWDRLTVFWTLLRLQYLWIVVWLIPLGVYCLASERKLRPLLILYLGAFSLNYIFVMNTVQDVMAYLLGPFLIMGLLIGFGLAGLSLPQWWKLIMRPGRTLFSRGIVLVNMVAVVIIPFTPIAQVVQNLRRDISLAGYTESDDYVAAVRAQFDGSGEGAVLLNDWEHMTPLWYERLVDERWFDEGDVRPIFVAFSKPWIEHVFENLPAGPVYLNRFERSVFDAGFRLRARGEQFWQVVEPGDQTIPLELDPINFTAGDIEVVGFNIMPLSSYPHTPTEMKGLSLAMRAPQGTDDFYVPFLLFANGQRYEFTTDSHHISPEWLPNEVIVERFEYAMSPSASVPVQLGVKNLNSNQEFLFDINTNATESQIDEYDAPRVLANFRQRTGLKHAYARNGWFDRRRDVWDEPFVAQSDDTIHLTLDWEVLEKPEDSYTVFVHLIDLANRPIIDSLDYTPLGGATPSHLWFPKWLKGQRMLDPYQMDLADVPPGEYLIEVGLYEQFTKRRLHIHDENGNLNGDRFILGKVIVEK